MWNICAISGSQVQDPVVSKKSGHVFERRLIEKHIEATGTCPITNQELSLCDIISLQTIQQIKPRIPTQTSIPDLLKVFQNEWDSLIIESFQLKDQLQTVRQELSHALYQHDAACRVIARVIKERDEARNELKKIQSDSKMDLEEVQIKTTLETSVVSEITELAFKLNSDRKLKKKLKEKAWEGYSDQSQISNFKQKQSQQLHAAGAKKGINCLDIHPQADQYICTGGIDGNAIVFDRTTQKTVSTLAGHKKKITDVVFIPNSENISVLVCSEDGKGSIFDSKNAKGKVTYKVDTHTDSLTACDIHPIGSIFAVASYDQSFSFHDVNVGKSLGIVKLEKSSQYSSVKFHPDGHVMALGGADGTIKIWNLTDDSLLENLQAHKGEVDFLSFSENGYYFASGSKKDGVVNVWDLRNQIKTIKTFYENENVKLGCLNFDQSGQFLAVGQDQNMFIYSTKNFESFTKFQSHSDLITDLKFGNYSKFIASVSMDRNLSILE